MSNKRSREQDGIVKKAVADMGMIEHEKLDINPAGMDTHASGAIGGGDAKGRKGKIHKGEEGAARE